MKICFKTQKGHSRPKLLCCAFGNFNALSVRLVNTFRRLRASGANAYLMFARLRINTNSEFTFYQADNQNLNKNFQISSVNRSILKNNFRQKLTPEISRLVDHWRLRLLPPTQKL